MTSWLMAATDKSANMFWFIFQSIKFQKTVKTAHYNFPKVMKSCFILP